QPGAPPRFSGTAHSTTPSSSARSAPVECGETARASSIQASPWRSGPPSAGATSDPVAVSTAAKAMPNESCNSDSNCGGSAARVSTSKPCESDVEVSHEVGIVTTKRNGGSRGGFAPLHLNLGHEMQTPPEKPLAGLPRLGRATSAESLQS